MRLRTFIPILATALIAVAVVTFNTVAHAQDPPKPNQTAGQPAKVELSGTLDQRGHLQVGGDVPLPATNNNAPGATNVTVKSTVKLSREDEEKLATLISAMNASNGNVSESLTKLTALGVKNQEILDAFNRYLQTSQQQSLLNPDVLANLGKFKDAIVNSMNSTNSSLARLGDAEEEQLGFAGQVLGAAGHLNASFNCRFPG